MRMVIQRVSSANVSIDGQIKGAIEKGLLVLLGIEDADDTLDVEWLVSKLVQMRIFADEDGKMNCSVQDINGAILLISQFTLYANTKKGNRPSFIRAARPEKAIPLYEACIEAIKKTGLTLQTGEFGADMQVSLTNDGPVTIIIDSKQKE